MSGPIASFCLSVLDRDLSLDFIEQLSLLFVIAYLPIFIGFGADAGAAAEPGIGTSPSTILR